MRIDSFLFFLFLGIFVCSQNGKSSIRKQTCRHSNKFGYQPEMKYSSLFILLYVWLHSENLLYEYGDLKLVLPSLLATENLQK